MADKDDKESLILEIVRNALVHGLDSNGFVVGEDATPAYGGTEATEDFCCADNLANTLSFNVYVEYLDELDKPGDPLIPFLMVTSETPIAQTDFVDNSQGFAMTITILAFLGQFDGIVTPNAIAYTGEKAARVFRKRLVDMLNVIEFPDVVIYEQKDVQGMDTRGPAEGDNWSFLTGASITIQYLPEI